MITLRPATMEDASKLLEWRNDPVIRQNSFQTEIITLVEHTTWLAKFLSDGHKHLFIILQEAGEAIGQVRFDVDSNKAEINIGLSAEYRGKGYGVESIRHSSSWFLQQHPEIDQIFSRIKLANQTSIKAFTKAGYSQAQEVDQVIYMVYI